MSDWDYCPYCDEELSMTDVYDTSDGYLEEGFATCPRCRKAFAHYTDVTIDFYLTPVDSLLDIAKTAVEFIDQEYFKPRKAFLEKLVAYNKKIDDGVLTEEEIEQYSDEWSGEYERME